MNRFQSNTLIICLGLGLLALSAMGFLFIPFRSNEALQVSFQAYTNDLKLGKLAVFAATNFSHESISFESCNPQTSHFDRWPQMQFVGEVKTLPAQANTNFTIAAFTNSGAWRQPVFWTYDDQSKLDDVRSKVKLNLYFNCRLIIRGNMPRYFNVSPGNSHMAFSSVITNK